MKIGELGRRSGLTGHTIRYYEKIGLLPCTGRDPSGWRDYDPSILAWIEFLGRLKTTGMPIREMLRYAALRTRGETSEPERQQMLEEHRAVVCARIAELQACVLVLDKKIDTYAAHATRRPDDERDPAPLRNAL